MKPICLACGTQYPDAAAPPPSCPVCEDERQFVRWEGQGWTDLPTLAQSHHVRVAEDHGVLGFDIEPHFAIGQRALLVETAQGNVLWDCISLVTREAVDAIRARGGVVGIAISHPHYYTCLGEWSEALGAVPVHLHEADAEWVRLPHPSIRFWSGERLQILPEATLIRCGGHFPGATVLHRSSDEGDLFVGDVLQVGQDRTSVSFMWSYPNYIPLDAPTVRRIAAAVAPFRYDRILGAFRGRTVAQDGEAVVARSVDRYLRAIGSPPSVNAGSAIQPGPVSKSQAVRPT